MHAVRSLHLTLTLGAVPAHHARGPHDRLQNADRQRTTRPAATGRVIETANSFASLNEVLSWSIAVGLLLALGVLAMTVGLIRSETASELRVLTAAGASRRTRRTLTAVTAGPLGFVGAALGLVTAYLLVAAFLATTTTTTLASSPRTSRSGRSASSCSGCRSSPPSGGCASPAASRRASAHQPIE